MKKIGLIGIVILAALFVCDPSASHASISISGIGPLGSFSGALNYSYIDSATAQLVVSLTNTSPVANGGYLTAFVLNNPVGQISGVSLNSDYSGFRLLGSPSFNNNIIGSPYGRFDIGAGVGGGFEGGGKPSAGIAVGSTGNFIFTFTGTDLDMLTEQFFLSETSVPPGAGEGVESFVTRFRGFNDGGSNHVTGHVVPVPEPATVLLLGAGLTGFAFRRRKV